MRYHDLLQIILDRELQKQTYELLAPVVIPKFDGMVFVTKKGKSLKEVENKLDINYWRVSPPAPSFVIRKPQFMLK